MKDGSSRGGTGTRLGNAAIVVAGVASLAASLLSILSIWLQLKNYRKPLLQRYVVRILLMVPLYSASSWASLMSIKAAAGIDPIRDIYEAFTIYTFFQLLINFLGGERALIILMHGRPPVNHLWPLNHFLGRVDLSDPHTFLAIKRGILQYAWLKPILGIATIVMKATDTYQEGYVGLRSGYFWSGLVYNISVTLSLYSLGMFWVCTSQDLKPFRPMPKFLCIKLIIFASYWQGFFLSILVWLGAIPDDVKDYTPDNIAAAIQDALICFEMPIFAVAHWYAFSWHDYADQTISSARLPVLYALRDSFGIRDLIEDTKMTFGGKTYEYRLFDSGDDVLAHEESGSRVARMMEGMRYERGGKGKYWIPQPGKPSSRTPLLAKSGPAAPRTQLERGDSSENDNIDEVEINEEDERLFANARSLEFGDWNYPVITAHEPSRERWMNHEPDFLTPSTNRNLLQPTLDNRTRRENNIRKTIDKGKRRSNSSDDDKTDSRAPMLTGLLRKHSSTSSSKSDRSQLVDLVVEDSEAEETERVRARKEGGPVWNEVEPKRFVRTYPDSDEGEEIREGFEPTDVPPLEDHHSGNARAGSAPKEVDDDENEAAEGKGQGGDAKGTSHEGTASGQKAEENEEEGDGTADNDVRYGSLNEERHVWGSGEREA